MANTGGYQLFDRVASGISADIQLASLGNFAPSPETASEYANAPNTGRFSGIQARNADEAQFLRIAEATFGDSSTWTE